MLSLVDTCVYMRLCKHGDISDLCVFSRYYFTKAIEHFSVFTELHLNTWRVGRIHESYANLSRILPTLLVFR